MKVRSLFYCLSAAAILLQSCESEEYKTTDTGLKYRFHVKSDTGRKPAINDFITLQMVYSTEKDSVLFDTREQGLPVRLQLIAPQFRGSIEEGFAMMAEGDSATFLVSADSIYERIFRAPLPETIRKGSLLTFHLKMENVQDLKEMEEERRVYLEKRQHDEVKNILDYIRANNVTVTPTETGLYFLSEAEGTGPLADTGQVVVVHYTGKFLDGQVFDTSLRPGGEPFEFQLGRGEVIQAWEEGIRKMRRGGKAMMLAPSHICYGAQGSPPVIPPYSPLLFKVEVLEIRNPSGR